MTWRRRGIEPPRRPLLRGSLVVVAATAAAPLFVGCALVVEPPVVATGVAVEATGPVIEGPGVVAIDVEPPPDERVYVYDAGFPPGVYLDGGFYWYGGYRYPPGVFVNGYVAVNLREHRYADVAENRRAGMAIEQQHRAEYAKTGGKRSSGPAQAHAQSQVRAQSEASHSQAAPPPAAHPPAVRPPAPRPPASKKK